MEGRGGEGVGNHERRRRAPLNRAMPGLRLSHRIDLASGSRRRRRISMHETPHIPEAARYFRDIERQESQQDTGIEMLVASPREGNAVVAERQRQQERNVVVAERQQPQEGNGPLAAKRQAGNSNAIVASERPGPSVGIPVRGNETVGSRGAPPGSSSPRKLKRHGVAAVGIPERPNLKHSMKKVNGFVKSAELEAREISVHRVCASKKILSWNLLLDRGKILYYTMARASEQNGFSAESLRAVEKVYAVNIRVEVLVEQFKERLEEERKNLKSERGTGSRIRTCCRFCATKERR